MTELRYLTQASELDELLTDRGSLIVNFTATWCGPCKRFAPVLEEVADETSMRVVKVDIDAVEELKDRFHVMGVPMTVVFTDGEMMTKFSGGKSKAELLELISPLIEI